MGSCADGRHERRLAKGEDEGGMLMMDQIVDCGKMGGREESVCPAVRFILEPSHQRSLIKDTDTMRPSSASSSACAPPSGTTYLTIGALCVSLLPLAN